MGQKCNPISLRLGITQTCRSRWYANKKEFGKFLLEDYKIRQYVKRNPELHSAGIPKVEIERSGDLVRLILHTASPGMLIGKRGKNVEKLTEDIEKLISKKVELKIEEVKDPLLNAQLTAEAIAEQLEKRAQFRRLLRKFAETIIDEGAQGVKIQLSGRIGGAEIARSSAIILGKLPLHTLRADIDYGFSEAIISKGVLGVKVWINKGEIIPQRKVKKETQNEIDAQTGQVPEVTKG